jgi:pectate lyase
LFKETENEAWNQIFFTGSRIRFGGGTTVTVSSFADFKKYAEEVETPYVILVKGEINTNIPLKIDGSGAVSVENNKTIIGLGSCAFFNRVGLSIQKAQHHPQHQIHDERRAHQQDRREQSRSLS